VISALSGSQGSATEQTGNKKPPASFALAGGFVSLPTTYWSFPQSSRLPVRGDAGFEHLWTITRLLTQLYPFGTALYWVGMKICWPGKIKSGLGRLLPVSRKSTVVPYLAAMPFRSSPAMTV